MHILITIILCVLICPLTAQPTKTIGIFTYNCSASKPWDPDSIKQGITGSEEAIIYMSQELAKLDYQVMVFGNPPANSPYFKADANPRYVPLTYDDGTQFDIAIAWRTPDAAERLGKRASAVYLWPHDTFHWPLNNGQINGFKDVLWISKWQRNQWVTVNQGFSKFQHIFGNGIAPSQFQPVKERTNPHSCIYGSNYARGLEILLDIWPEVRKQFPKATLDIYYGWQHWGLLTPDKEIKMRKQVAELGSLGISEHGLVGHEELNRAYEKASIWAYPCIAPETFCITALRAQLAGAVPVIIEGSALSETVRFGYSCKSPQDYLATLLKALKDAESFTVDDRRQMGGFVLKEYTWKAMAQKWHDLFSAQKRE